MKISSFLIKLYLLLALAIVPLNADTLKLDDFKMVNVESVEVLPDLKTQSLTLKITVLFWQIFQYQTFEVSLDWNSTAILNTKVGDQIGWRSQNLLDFSSFGFSYYDVYFPDSNVILTARGKANIPLHILERRDSLMHVFGLNDTQDGYLSFFSEGNTKWFVDKNNLPELKNSDSFYIDYTSERFAAKVIGASFFKILSSTGQEIGEIIGESTKDWEPDPNNERVFTVLNVRKDRYDQCYVTLRHDQTGKEFFLKGYFLGLEGEKILVLDKSYTHCKGLIYYIVDRKMRVGDKVACQYAQYGVDVNLSVYYVSWPDAFEEISIFPDASYNYWTNPPLYRKGEDGAAWFIKDFCPKSNGNIPVDDFFNMVQNYCRENSMNLPTHWELRYTSALKSIVWARYISIGCD